MRGACDPVPGRKLAEKPVGLGGRPAVPGIDQQVLGVALDGQRHVLALHRPGRHRNNGHDDRGRWGDSKGGWVSWACMGHSAPRPPPASSSMPPLTDWPSPCRGARRETEEGGGDLCGSGGRFLCLNNACLPGICVFPHQFGRPPCVGAVSLPLDQEFPVLGGLSLPIKLEDPRGPSHVSSIRLEIVKSPGAASPPSDWKFSDYGGRVSPIRSLGAMYSRCCLFCELARPQNRGSYSSPLRWKDSTGWEVMSPPSVWKFQFIIGLGLSSQLGTPEVEWGACLSHHTGNS